LPYEAVVISVSAVVVGVSCSKRRHLRVAVPPFFIIDPERYR
jgi:hypothetical protein